MIAIVLGTRPEIIKMSPVIRECERRGMDYFILHTGQHYSYEMDRVFFEELELPEAKFNLDAGSGSHGVQTARILEGIEHVLLREDPDIVLVQGDTNTVMAAALAAVKLHIPVGHVEAGLRSFDHTMPEEINRIVADHVSDVLFAPTRVARTNLLREGIPEERIQVTGNTIVDAVFQNLEVSERRTNALELLGLEPDEYLLCTAHRAENVDSRMKLEGILHGLSRIRSEYSLPVVFPVHPRTRERIMDFNLSLDGIQTIDPLGYLEFLQLERHACLILTDSGGVQEEACILHVPCITLRENTERPETLEVGSNLLVGTDEVRIVEGVEKMLNKEREWVHPFGDGMAGKRIVEIIRNSSIFSSR
ncbi:MAG: UDP-N-acetylglucosamine 2-epimerase (non-hydrolyzing) [Methanomicrobiales archaeon]|nr:UDP-N-acetylglucosamine 2-epimerase (non-hydrolyzing) [Methanomicrobiales archaeon]